MARSLDDLIGAARMLGSEVLDSYSVGELDAAGEALSAAGVTLRGLAALKRARLDSQGARPSGDELAGRFAEPVASAAPATFSVGSGQTNVQLDPHQPPPPEVQCQEADEQRRDPQRIMRLRADPIAFLDVLKYYLLHIEGQLQAFLCSGGEPRTVESATPDESKRFTLAAGDILDDAMQSVECLPGMCPPSEKADVGEMRAAWQQCYDVMQMLLEKSVLDDDDRAQILLKLGDRPGGKLGEPDFTQPAPPDPPPTQPEATPPPSDESPVSGAPTT